MADSSKKNPDDWISCIDIEPENGKYDPGDCQAAIEGSRIPKTFDEDVHRLCTIRGIRHHYGFAQELRGVSPDFTRALNARDIMSGIIPIMSTPEEVPYCFWYPDIPKEETLRRLLQQYPDMVYQVARVCAVAGYLDLYKNLDVLPEVHIAEEAGYAAIQRNNKSCREIYNLIISQPIKFEIMNDYARTVNTAGPGCRIAFLNGDTAVHSSLAVRAKYCGYREIRKPYMAAYFNITEDWGIDDHDCKYPSKEPEDYFPLVYNPLPADLPLINKDKLIQLAAYNGDIDRYARLRRPQMLENEWAMAVHGIYHSPAFAKWWDKQLPEHPEHRHMIKIRRAVNARRIMSDDISWVTMDTPREAMPNLIWYPNVAHSMTYENLAFKRPDMLWSCLESCIIAGYTWTWDTLLHAAPEILKGEKMYPLDPSVPEPKDPKLWWLSKRADLALWRMAAESKDRHFQNDICAAIPDAAKNFSSGGYLFKLGYYEDYYVASDLYSVPKRDPVVHLHDPIQPATREDQGPYDGMDCGIDDFDIALFLGSTILKETWKGEILDHNREAASVDEVWELLDMEQAK